MIMKPLSSLLVAAAVVAAACAPPRVRPSPPAGAPAPASIEVRYLDDGRTITGSVPLEEYVAGAILSEFTPSAADRPAADGMLQVQAIIARTYAVAHLGRHRSDGFDLCATTHCQLYDPAGLRRSRLSDAVASAVRRTSASVLWFDGHAVLAHFHADCGGHTSTPADVWGGRTPPYLVSARDGGPAETAHASWRYAASADGVRRALNAGDTTRVGSRLERIDVTGRDRAGRAVRVRLQGDREVTVRGGDLRDALSRAFGARSIRSTLFHVTRTREAYTFEGRGFGHGVGLCQWGAYALAKSGKSPTEIVKHYYPKVKIMDLW